MLEDAAIHYVDSADDARSFVEWCIDLTVGRRWVAIDTECTGLEWWTPRFVRLVQFGTENEAWAVDTERWRGAVEEALQRIVAARCPVIFHNCAFDMHALEGDGYPVPAWADVHDTMFMHHLLYPHESHALKVVAASFFGNGAYIGQGALKALFKSTGTTWATVDTRHPDYWVYGCMDTILTWRIAKILLRELHEHGFVQLYEREMAVREVLSRSETRGLLVDRQWTDQLMKNWSVEAIGLAAQLQQYGIENPASNAQVTGALEQLEWEPDEWTPTGAVKLDKIVLDQLAALRPEWAAIAGPILRYRRLTKWMSAYLNPFLNNVDSEGRLHHSIRSLRAVTGRMSITEPAMQTLPSRDDGAWMIRRCIMAESGQRIYAVDYANQEARLFAHYSQDPRMLATIRSGEDLYTAIARIIYDNDAITKGDRERALTKVNTLAFTYGAGVDKLSKTSGLSIPDTELFVRRLFEQFPNVRDLTGDHAIGGHYPGGPALVAQERGHSEGLRYVLTKSGRRFSVPNEEELYKCVNGLMQGSGADILKDAIIRLDQLGYGDNIMLPVHDELLFQFPIGEEGEYAARECASIMCDHSLSVPITTELSGPFETWGHHYMEVPS